MQQMLTDRHKECLRDLVKLVREGTISEEFYVLYAGQGAIIPAKTANSSIQVDGLSRLGLEALTRAGLIFSLPNYERRSSDVGTMVTERESEGSRSCFITPEGFRAVDNDFAPFEDIVQRRPPIEITASLSAFRKDLGFRAVDNDFAPFEDIVQRRPPIEITASLAAFRKDFPDPSRIAFIMMQFGHSKAHIAILGGIRRALDPHQFIALRADDKQYHDNLFFNILTYVYGCRFGIAVFERIESDAFNPNVSLEVGYLLGIDKPVCFLKDHTLKTLHTDLIGQLYKEFDPLSCETTIPPALWKWMEDKGIMSPRIETIG